MANLKHTIILNETDLRELIKKYIAINNIEIQLVEAQKISEDNISQWSLFITFLDL